MERDNRKEGEKEITKDMQQRCLARCNTLASTSRPPGHPNISTAESDRIILQVFGQRVSSEQM